MLKDFLGIKLTTTPATTIEKFNESLALNKKTVNIDEDLKDLKEIQLKLNQVLRNPQCTNQSFNKKVGQKFTKCGTCNYKNVDQQMSMWFCCFD